MLRWFVALYIANAVFCVLVDVGTRAFARRILRRRPQPRTITQTDLMLAAYTQTPTRVFIYNATVRPWVVWAGLAVGFVNGFRRGLDKDKQ